MNIAMGKVATSAYEAFDMGILENHKDIVVVNKNRQIAEAKKVAKLMAEQGYTPVSYTHLDVYKRQALKFSFLISFRLN